MGLLGRLIGIVADGAAKSVGDVVSKAVAEAVKPAATKLAQKQADLIDEVANNIEKGTEAIKEAGEATEAAASSASPEQVKMAMEFLRQNAARAAEEIANIKDEEPQSDEDFLAKWDEHLADYPKWTVGGDHFHLDIYEAEGEMSVYTLDLSGVEANLRAYQALLMANGFVPKYPGSMETLVKTVGDRRPAMMVHPDCGIDETQHMVCVQFFDDSQR